MSKADNTPKLVPQLSSKEKLEQIRSGKVLVRRKSGLDIKAIVVSGKDGSKIIKKKMTERFEETTVKRKKRNYVMYESKLGTEKNTEIKSVHKPKPKPAPKVRVPTPRKDEKIITVKKRHPYLDNYQYHETKMLKKRQPSIVFHRRLGSAFPESNYSTITATTVGRKSPSPRLTDNRSDMLKAKKTAVTTTNFYRKPIIAVNPKTPQNDMKFKSGLITKQILSRRNASPQPKEKKNEVSQSPIVNSRIRGLVKTPYTTLTAKTSKTSIVINKRRASGDKDKDKDKSGKTEEENYKTITVHKRSTRNKYKEEKKKK